ncbi:MAG: hypothetical protein IKJ59_11835 [Clostridia bacterium]|nr:hypothetical protein [Clostridia bacterium]
MKEFLYKNISNIYHSYVEKNGTMNGASSLLSIFFGFVFMATFLLFLVYLEKKWGLNCNTYYMNMFRIEFSRLERINLLPCAIPPYLFGYLFTYFFLTHNKREEKIYKMYDICDKKMGVLFFFVYPYIPLVLLFILIII